MKVTDNYIDGVKPLFPGVMERIQRYDPRLVLRLNRTRGQYELWRFRPDLPIPSNPTSSEITQKAAPQIEVKIDQFDHRVFRRLWLGDLTHRAPNLSADEVNKQLARQDRAKEEADEKMRKDSVADVIDDNRGMFRRNRFTTSDVHYARREHGE